MLYEVPELQIHLQELPNQIKNRNVKRTKKKKRKKEGRKEYWTNYRIVRPDQYPLPLKQFDSEVNQFYQRDLSELAPWASLEDQIEREHALVAQRWKLRGCSSSSSFQLQQKLRTPLLLKRTFIEHNILYASDQ